MWTIMNTIERTMATMLDINDLLIIANRQAENVRYTVIDNNR